MAELQRNPIASGPPMKKNFLFIMARGPFDGLYVQECMDIVLTAAAFEQSVNLLFIDDGVHLLNKEQCPGWISAKHIAPLFQALDIYEVDDVWVEEESLQEAGITPEALSVSARLLPRSRVAKLIGENDLIYSG